MGIEQALKSLGTDFEAKEKRTILSFNQFLEILADKPEKVLRNIFQVFHDMITSYVGEGKNDNPNDPESIGFVKYDCSRLFVRNSDNPFFADTLFANRLMRQVGALRQGSQQNRIYVYLGPHGCGKSTFLNNLLAAFEEYMNLGEGQGYEIMWEISDGKEKFTVPCPSHDHPILLIPRNYRITFLDNLLPDRSKEFKYGLSLDKEYEWLFRSEVCTICKSLLNAQLDGLGSLEKVLETVRVRHYRHDRCLGEGISVFNPGDKPSTTAYYTDRQIQQRLDKVFGANLVKYVFSPLARTNNGIYVLMDVKSENIARFMELHNVISEGVHKINGIVEESVSSLFLALMNPEDLESVRKDEAAKSIIGRIEFNPIRYILDVPTEIQIYRSTFGEQLSARFLPKVLENFARVIISSRLEAECPPLKEWIPHMKEYARYCDDDGRLLRMEIFGGVIPQWLSEEDKKKLTAEIRRKLIKTGEKEGQKGFTGRDSIRLFGDFLNYHSSVKLLTMSHVADFFKHRIGKDVRDGYIPKGFIGSLVKWYDYEVLSAIKESLYFYNQKRIADDILNFLYAVNYEVGSVVTCDWTGQEIQVSLDFFVTVGACLSGMEMGPASAVEYAKDIQKRFVEVLAQERNRPITETPLYQELLASYVKRLKEKAPEPFLRNENFRGAVRCYGIKEFNTFDTRIKEHVVHMIQNLIFKFGYTQAGAQEVCLYAIDQKLVDKFPSH
jgi:predicted Ser/Thr protein kinase